MDTRLNISSNKHEMKLRNLTHIQTEQKIFPQTQSDSSQVLSHRELMHSLAHTLGVGHTDVYIGIVVEQALVGIAGIDTSQKVLFIGVNQVLLILILNLVLRVLGNNKSLCRSL